MNDSFVINVDQFCIASHQLKKLLWYGMTTASMVHDW